MLMLRQLWGQHNFQHVSSVSIGLHDVVQLGPIDGVRSHIQMLRES